jgi:hypothetical protein
MLRFHSVVVALLLAPAALWSQRNTVPLDDPVYQDLDRILGIGLVDHPIVGQRPFTRAEIARLVAQARSGSGARAVSPVVARLIERLEHRFGDTTRAIAPPRWRADALGLSSP